MRADFDRQDLYRGFGDALARAVEMVAVPFLFGLAGHGLDSVRGIRPVLTIVLAALGVGGEAARSYYGYVRAMDDARGRR